MTKNITPSTIKNTFNKVKNILKPPSILKTESLLFYFIFITSLAFNSTSYSQSHPFDKMDQNKIEALKNEQCHTTLKEYEHYKSLSYNEKEAFKKASLNYEKQLRVIAEQLKHGQRRTTPSNLIIPINPETDPEYTTIPEYTIPVVFHVIHDGDDDFVLTETQVKRAIKRVNEDFNGLSENRNTIQDQFKTDESRVGIRFVLAQKDPEGKPTNGITYGVHYRAFTTNQAQFHTMRRQTKWPTNKYLNIWILNRYNTYEFVDGDTTQGGSGYAWLPQHDNGLTTNGSSTGITMAYWVLGDRVENEENLSTFRHILTHEIGHWLGLNHSWGSGYSSGDSAACNADDGIDDTPNTVGEQYKEGFNNCNYTFSSCGQETNVHEFMNYTPCTSMFTNGQKAAMIAALNSDVAGRDNVISDTNLTETLYVSNPNTSRISYSSDLGSGSRKFREERIANTGVIGTKTMIYLENVNFSNATIGQDLIENTHFTTTNTPDGLSAKINIIDSNKASFTFTGNATDHSARSVTDFKISFNNAAFENKNVSEIENATDIDFEIQFRNHNDVAPYRRLLTEGTLYNNSDNEEFGFYQRMRVSLNYGNSVLAFKFSNNNLYVRSNTESGASGFVLQNDGSANGPDQIALLNKGQVINSESNWSLYNRDHDLEKNWKKIISQDDPNIDNYLDKDLYIGTYLTYDGQIFYRWVSFTLFKTEHGNLGLKLIDSAFPVTPTTEIKCGELFEQINPVNYLITGYPFTYESIQNNGELNRKTFQFILRGNNSFKNNVTADDYVIGIKDDNDSDGDGDKDEIVNTLPEGISIASVETLDNGKRLQFTFTGNITNHNKNVISKFSLKPSAYTDSNDTENGLTSPADFTFLTVDKKITGDKVNTRLDKDKTYLQIAGGGLKFQYKVDYTKATPETRIIMHADGFGASVKFGAQIIADDTNTTHVKILDENTTVLDENLDFTFPRDENGKNIISPFIIHSKDYKKWENKTGYIGYFYAVGRFRYYMWIKIKVGEQGEYIDILEYGSNSLSHQPVNIGEYTEPLTEYCTAKQKAEDGVYITKVQLGDMINETGNSGYSDYTDIPIEINAGTEQTLTLNTKNEHWTYNAIGVWIDWNNNFDFNDPGEKVFHKYEAGPYSTQITIPDAATIAPDTKIRMRVKLAYGREDYIVPCGENLTRQGEVEDYTITIKGGTLGSNDINLDTTASIYPVPFTDSFTIDLTKVKGQSFQIKLYDLQGKMLLQETFTQNPGKTKLTANNLNSGVYLVKVTTGEDSKTSVILKK